MENNEKDFTGGIQSYIDYLEANKQASLLGEELPGRVALVHAFRGDGADPLYLYK